ncbi:MAG TPA: O-antigen ligase family protein [Ktedonobacteraceae bacterium]|nr:O-antigen ligase family protein [Ktedonobacteraceae bacterium]
MQQAVASGIKPARRDFWPNLRTVQDFFTIPNVIVALGCFALVFMLIVLPLPWNLRLPLYLAALVWTILRPRAALYLMAFAVPWGSLDYINVSTLRLDSADILVVFLVIGWLLQWCLPARVRQQQRDEARVPGYLALAMLALLFTMLLSTVVAINIKDSLKEISKWLEVLALLMLGSQYLQTRRQIWTMIVLICLAGITQAIFGYFQAGLNLGPQSFIRGASLRVYGTFDQPNPYAAYINMPLSIALALTLLSRDWLTRLLAGITVVSLGLAELLSQSRGGEIALAAALTFILLAGMPRVRTLMRIGIFAILAGLAAAMLGLLPSSLTSSALKFLGLEQISFSAPSAQDYSTAERLAHWIAGLNMFFDHPILGVGIGNYPDAYAPYHITIFLDSLGHAHNYYINIAAEMGTIGLVVYLGFVAALFVLGGHAIRSLSRRYHQERSRVQAQPGGKRPIIQKPLELKDKVALLLQPQHMMRVYRSASPLARGRLLANDRALAIGITAALVTVAVHNLVDDVYVHSLTNLIALLLIALIRLERVTPGTETQAAYGGQVDFTESR